MYSGVKVGSYRSDQKILASFPSILVDAKDLGDLPSDVSLKELLICLSEGRNSYPKCPCGKFIRWSPPANKLKTYCSKTCSDKFKILDCRKIFLQNLPHIADNATISERVYCLKYNLDARPLCPTCNNEIKFHYCYGKYCSKKCANSNSDKILKTKENFIEKYGISSHMQLKSTKDKFRAIRLKSTYKSLSRFSDHAIPLFTEEAYIGCGYENLYPWECSNCHKSFDFYVYSGEVPRCPQKETRRVWTPRRGVYVNTCACYMRTRIQIHMK
jgi:hypothetical protein